MADQNGEARAASNSELRFLALELMKLAQRKKVTFSDMCAEFVSNVYELEGVLNYCASNEANAEENETANTAKKLSKEKL